MEPICFKRKLMGRASRGGGGDGEGACRAGGEGGGASRAHFELISLKRNITGKGSGCGRWVTRPQGEGRGVWIWGIA